MKLEANPGRDDRMKFATAPGLYFERTHPLGNAAIFLVECITRSETPMLKLEFSIQSLLSFTTRLKKTESRLIPAMFSASHNTENPSCSL